jgi:hypothetical protein
MTMLLVPALASAPASAPVGPLTTSGLPAGLWMVIAVPRARVLLTRALLAASAKVGVVMVRGELLMVSVTPPTDTVPAEAVQLTLPAAPASNVWAPVSDNVFAPVADRVIVLAPALEAVMLPVPAMVRPEAL